MKAPISKQAEEIFKDPDKAQRLIEAIRSMREKRTDSAPVTLDHKNLNVQIVRIDHSTDRGPLSLQETELEESFNGRAACGMTAGALAPITIPGQGFIIKYSETANLNIVFMKL